MADDRLNHLLERLDVPVTPDSAFADSLYQRIAPLALAGGRRDRTWYGRIGAAVRSTPISPTRPLPINVRMVFAAATLLALLLAFAVIIGSRSSDPPQCAGPEDVPAHGLLLWLRAGSGVETASNQAVTGWASAVGSLVAVPNGRTQQPVLLAEGLGGHPAVRFDGENDELVADLNINPSVHPGLTIVSLFVSDVALGDPKRKVYGADDGGYDRAAGLDYRASNGMNYTVFGGGDGVVGYFRLEATDPYLTVDNYRSGAFSGWVNGSLVLDRRVVTNGEGPPVLYVGGSGTEFSEPWQGTISEVLVFGTTLSESARNCVEDYLANTYGLTLSR
jgi:hypothetical protein